MKPKITLCLLNYFEDWLVCRAIAQSYDFVDEILIGDCSKGKDFLSKFIQGLKKCRIVPDPGIDEGENFSWAEWRNHVESFASGDWILWQDPDEIYPLPLLKRLKRLTKLWEGDAISFNRIAHETHKRIEIRNKEPKVRCWKNVPYIKWNGKIHEVPVGFKKVLRTNIPYYHDINWLPSFPQRIYKLKKRERRGNILPRIQRNDLDPYRDLYPDEKENEAFESRE